MKNLSTNITESFSVNERLTDGHGLYNDSAKKRFCELGKSPIVGKMYMNLGIIKNIEAKNEEITEIELTFFGSKNKRTLIWKSGIAGKWETT